MIAGRRRSPSVLAFFRRFSDAHLDFVIKEVEGIQSSKPDELPISRPAVPRPSDSHQKMEISHPWSEWVELMEMLVQKRYFVGASSGLLLGSSPNALKDANKIRTASLNFARDRFDIIRFLSRTDIHDIVNCGCPSVDRKIVNSGKRLRAFVGIEEGDVCSMCNLRGMCERAYVKAREDEGGRTLDVMRILLAYGLDPLIGSIENKACLTKPTKELVRRLMKQMVEHGTKEVDPEFPKPISVFPTKKRESLMKHRTSPARVDLPLKQGDWICPKCNFLNFAKNLKCLRCDGLSQERLQKIREETEFVMMKKGDWLCDKCNFLNFAKNGKCLQCGEKPPKRQLNPGEWECPSCNYINFRRNMVCRKCEWKRPKAECFSGSFGQFDSEHPDYRRGSRMTFVKIEGEATDDELCNTGEPGPLKFKDFPMRGGKSEISMGWDGRFQEPIGAQGAVNKNPDSWIGLSDDGCSNSSAEDDHDIAGWFGRRGSG
ncbi:Zinc finger protein [Nymphaea thermarum]|nr:Zinc finger protein [Nymphaea thermarum]